MGEACGSAPGTIGAMDSAGPPVYSSVFTARTAKGQPRDASKIAPISQVEDLLMATNTYKTLTPLPR